MPKAAAQERTVQQLRTLLGFDVAAWARILGVSPITIQRWEEDGVKPSGAAAEVFRGIHAALDAGAPPAAIRSRLNLGLAQLVCASLSA